MPIAEVVVTSLGDLIDQVTPPDPDDALGRRRDSGVYHGSSDAARPLLTSLDRLGDPDRPHGKRDVEAHVLRNFVRYSRAFFPPGPISDWELLVAAQHHGVPTRLLDWTYSPLVAAHFATSGTDLTVDRAVWRLDWKCVHRAFDLPELALLFGDLDRHLGNGSAFTPWQLFDGDAAGAPFACMLEPPSLDARIVSQSATFTLCSDNARSFDAFLEHHGLGGALTKFVIPAAETARLRDQLDLVGIDEQRLFPDLDGLAARMRRYYG
jgi:hypothetical protein